MTDVDAMVAWQIGLAAFKKARDYGAKFSHDPTQPQKDRRAELEERLQFICKQLDDLSAQGAYKSDPSGIFCRGRLEDQYDRLLKEAGKIEIELGL